MATAIRLRRFGAIAAASGAVYYTLLSNPSISSNDRSGGGPFLTAIKQKITDPFSVVPSRNVQESALMGSSSSNPLDILVVGGGATGCGVALDATTRGLRVGLVEREDFSSGTSSRSTKLIHGGQHFILRIYYVSTVYVNVLYFEQWELYTNRHGLRSAGIDDFSYALMWYS